MARAGGRGLLERVGLHRPELRAWALYDWANSAYWTTVAVAVFPTYFSRVVAAGLEQGVAAQRFTLATVIAQVIVALIAPALGAMADLKGTKKRLLAGFAAFGVAATAAMFFLSGGDWVLALVLLVAGNVGVAGSAVCYDSLLPSVAREDEYDRVSSAGYAVGYLGGGLLLVLNVAWILHPELFGLPSGEGLSESERTLPTRLAFLSVAVWWALFTIPLLRRVPEPPPARRRDGGAQRRGLAVVRAAYGEVWQTLHELRSHRHAFVCLIAILLYGEGIGAIIRLAGVYTADLPGIDDSLVLKGFVFAQFIGIPCAMAFGMLADRIGTRRAIYVALAIYVLICVLGFYLRTGRDFFVLASLVGLVQGGAQALGRSLFASLIPRDRAAEFFGFYALGSKFAGVFGPLTFYAVAKATGENRWGILSLIVFFVAGAIVLSRVRLERPATR